MPSDEQGAPKLHIDSDWKASARAEKERLNEQQRTKETAADGDKGLPPATLTSMVEMFASQAIMGLGAFADRKTGRVVIDLQGAKFSIDMLQVLEDRTKGNLSKEEAEHLKEVLAELRSRFVQIVQLVSQQAAGGPDAIAPAAGPGIVAP